MYIVHLIHWELIDSTLCGHRKKQCITIYQIASDYLVLKRLSAVYTSERHCQQNNNTNKIDNLAINEYNKASFVIHAMLWIYRNRKEDII